MAWRAYVGQDIEATADGLLSIVIWYYDDADPANAVVNASTPPAVTLWAKAWQLPMNATVAQLQAAVVQEGQKARSWKTVEAAARSAVPKGTTVAIP